MPPGERQFDGLAGQGVALAGEQQPGGPVDVVAIPARPAAGLPERPLANRPPRSRACSPCFYLVEIRHRQLPK